MKVEIAPGKYVVAVSGGVDSMVLLDMLQKLPGVELVVAHYDHGIRPDSGLDRQLVQSVAKDSGLPFYYEEGKLGPTASEALARQKRYDFLERTRRQEHARAIVTAHQQDDLIETAVLNMLRGTGRRGLTSLHSNEHLVRPLLHLTKEQIRGYATEYALRWREDSTNADERYLRNYIRRQLLPNFTPPARGELLRLIGQTQNTNERLDELLAELLNSMSTSDSLGRRQFMQLPHAAAKELLASWLRARQLTDFDSRTLERVVIAAKVQAPGTIIDVMHGAQLRVGRDELALQRIER